MRRLFERLLRALHFFLCFAPIPILGGYWLIGDWRLACILLACVLPLAYVLSLLPGHVGGRAKKSSIAPSSARAGGDPNPDRDLRSDAHPEEKRRAFPLRAFVCALALIGVTGGAYWAVGFAGIDVWWPARLGMAALVAVMLPFALKSFADGEAADVRTTAVGVAIYVVTAIALFVIKNEQLTTVLGVTACVFLALSALMLNESTLISGVAARTGMRPPAAMRRKNRLLVAILAALVAFAALFDKLREGFYAGAQAVGAAIMQAILWISSLFANEQTGSGGMEGGGEMDLSALGEGAETAAIWVYLEKVAYVLAGILLLAGLCFAFYKIGKRLKKLWRALMAYLRSFAKSVGEDYADVQENLFDWGDVKNNLREDAKRRFERLFRRDPKWETLDARGKVRFVARALYRRRAGEPGLSAMTMREAAPLVAGTAADDLAELYDRARYSLNDVSSEEAERLRREAKA